MPVINKSMPYVISGVTIPGTLSVTSETGESTWTAKGQTTPTFVSKLSTNLQWREYAPGESVDNLVKLVPTLGQPPSEAAKYRERSGDRITPSATQDLKDTILIDLATNG